jgi:hypothetical protein
VWLYCVSIYWNGFAGGWVSTCASLFGDALCLVIIVDRAFWASAALSSGLALSGAVISLSDIFASQLASTLLVLLAHDGAWSVDLIKHWQSSFGDGAGLNYKIKLPFTE